MSRSSRWYKHGVLTILSFMMLPEAAFRVWPAMPRTPVALPAAASAPQNGLADDYDPRRDPEKDLAAARAEAKRSDRNIFVEVGGEWCSWCRVLDRFFHEHPGLEALRDKNYVSMKVSMSEENPNRAFLSRFPYIHGYPHIFILGAEGNLIHSQPTSVLEDGRGYNAQRFQKFLEQFAPKRSASSVSSYRRLTLPPANPKIEGPNVAGVAHW